MRKWTGTKTISIVMHMSQTAAWPVDRFRATLDRILTETGLSQGGLARLVNMNQSQISRWKTGASRPEFDTLKDVGEKLRSEYPTLPVGPNELLESAGYALPESSMQPPQQDATPTSFVDAIMRAEKLFQQALARDDVPHEELKQAYQRLREAEERILKRLLDRDEARAQQAARERDEVRRTGT